MDTNPAARRYSSPSIALHWLMAVLLAAAVAAIELKGIYPKGSPGRALLQSVHFSLGLAVFVLVWLRLLARALGTAPPITPAPPAWQTRLAHLVHAALYLLMIGLPLLGWLSLSAGGQPVALPWGMPLPLAPLTESRDTARWLRDLHETGATVGFVLVGLHTAAALVHHYGLRDNTLPRMLPGRR
jgi:superoxide oxidase